MKTPPNQVRRNGSTKHKSPQSKSDQQTHNGIEGPDLRQFCLKLEKEVKNVNSLLDLLVCKLSLMACSEEAQVLDEDFVRGISDLAFRHKEAVLNHLHDLSSALHPQPSHLEAAS